MVAETERKDMPSLARRAFDENSKDIRRLIEVWGEFEGLSKEVPLDGDEAEIPATRVVCLKSIIVLLVSYWEAYLEDIAEEALRHIVQNVKDPNNLPKELRKAVTKELTKEETELAVWKLCGDNWRKLCLERFNQLAERRNRNFNSPRSHLVNEFIQATIGLENLCQKWKADTLDSAGCVKRLDELIELRGAIAHRGKVTRTLTMAAVDADIKFINKLVATTGGAINAFVEKTTKIPLWEKSEK